MNRDGCILIIEDDEKNRKLFHDLLQVRGYKVLEAYNGRDGVDMARDKMPSLIVLDWQMPVMNGKEAVQEIKSNAATAEIPIIVVSALAMPDSINNIWQSGCDDFITKPINVQEFLEIVEKYVTPC